MFELALFEIKKADKILAVEFRFTDLKVEERLKHYLFVFYTEIDSSTAYFQTTKLILLCGNEWSSIAEIISPSQIFLF